MSRIFRMFRNIIFLTWLSVGLASFGVSAAIWGSIQTAKVAQLTFVAATHAKQLAKLKLITRAEGRLRSFAIAVPFFDLVVVGAFEELDRRKWLQDNPGKDSKDYFCRVAEATKIAVKDVEADLNDIFSGWPYMPKIDLASKIPECEKPTVEVNQ
jgi:hypothetical protein